MHNRIAEVRNQQGLTLIQLAKKIGVSDGTISRYETGDREPKLDTWQKLADVLGVSVPYLQGVSDIDFGNFDEIASSSLLDAINALADRKDISSQLSAGIAQTINNLLLVGSLDDHELDAGILALSMHVSDYVQDTRDAEFLTDTELGKEFNSILEVAQRRFAENQSNLGENEK